MALSAMDAKIVAKDLPADSDDGQYVLSAKKVGGTITYTWVKMDLTDAEKQSFYPAGPDTGGGN